MKTATEQQQADVVRRRPRDRKQQIVAAAAELFYRSGFHAVTMEEIAGAVGITAGALYRHFRNKQELLATTVLEGMAAFEAVIADTTPGETASLLQGMATLTIDRRDLGALWQRESRNLPETQRADLRHRFREIAAKVSAVLTAIRPELAPGDANLLAWVTFSVFASPSHHGIELPRDRFEELLFQIGTAVLGAPVSSGTAMGGVSWQGPAVPARLTRASRREALIDAAGWLFSERGYQSVNMEEIGAAVGMSGAGIYHHFTGKSDLLVAVLTRAAEWLQLETSRAFTLARTGREALELLLRSYISLTLTHSHLTGLLITDVAYLPDEQRHLVRALQHDYVSEWAQLLTAERPELTEPEARLVTHAALMIVNDTTRIDHLRRRPNLADDLTQVGRAVLLGHG